MTKEILQQALKSLIEIVRYAQHLNCTHDNTYRGGAIWEVCKDCGSQWADDCGGKPPYKVPPAIAAAKATIVAIKAAIAQPDELPIIGYLVHNEIGDTWLSKRSGPASRNPEPLCKISDALAQRVPQLDKFIQAVTDLENQPSQFGTVTLDFHFAKIKEWEDKFDRAIAMAQAAIAQPVPQAQGDAKDAERLDWLQSQTEAYGFQDMHEGNRWTIDGPFMFVRDAIDAAIASQKATQ